VPPQQGGTYRDTSNTQPRVADEDPCSVGQSALAGAAIGALFGGITKGGKGALKGALAGGAIGAVGCLAINASSRQTRTAAQVDQAYIQAHNRLPADPQVLAYTPSIASTAQRGQPVRLTSTVELVNGSQNKVTEVREELQVFDQSGKQFLNGQKPLSNSSGGRFENSFVLTLPESVSQGTYTMKTTLFVNGKLSATRNLQTQLVVNERGMIIVASR
jgi:uncharacterized protein affecting Mg2+/Co2+ transport